MNFFKILFLVSVSFVLTNCTSETAGVLQSQANVPTTAPNEPNNGEQGPQQVDPIEEQEQEQDGSMTIKHFAFSTSATKQDFPNGYSISYGMSQDGQQTVAITSLQPYCNFSTTQYDVSDQISQLEAIVDSAVFETGTDGPNSGALVVSDLNGSFLWGYFNTAASDNYSQNDTDEIHALMDEIFDLVYPSFSCE